MARQSRETAIPAFLVTRPAVQGQALAQDLHRDFGPDIRIVLSPLMEPVFLSPELEERQWTGILFTSANGVEGARRLSLEPDLPAYCVGEATAQAARKAGYRAQSADGDAGDLARLILGLGVRGPLLHARGQEVSGNLAAALKTAGIETIETIVYRQNALPLTSEALAHLSRPDPVIVPLYSPRTARLLSQQLQPHTVHAGIYVAAISPAVAKAVAFAAKGVAVADRPIASAMLATMAGLVATARQP